MVVKILQGSVFAADTVVAARAACKHAERVVTSTVDADADVDDAVLLRLMR